MPQTRARSPWYVSTIFVVIIVSLVIGGIKLIWESETQYKKSISYTDMVLNDSLLKNKVSLAPNYTLTKEGYSTALLYFTLAIGVMMLSVLLPRLQSINIGTSGVSLNLKDIPEKLDDIIKQNNAIQSSSAGEGGFKQKSIEFAPENIKKGFTNLLSASYNDDPQKGKWGGQAIRNGKELSAKVDPASDPEYFKVTIQVKGLDASAPLTGLVRFHLHNTFRNPDPVIAVNKNVAVLRLSKVYGAFTVGAEADNGKTTLELDLALDPSFPSAFTSR